MLDLLTSTYLNTTRDTNHKKRVTIVTQQGMTESYEFPNIKIYWQFIVSVKRSHEGIPITFCNRFTITQSELLALAASECSSGSGSGSGSGTKHDNKSKCDFKVTFAIRNGKLMYQLPKKEAATCTCIDLTSLTAMAISDDFYHPLNLLLKFPTFACNWNSVEGHSSRIDSTSPLSQQSVPQRMFTAVQYQSSSEDYKVVTNSNDVLLPGVYSNHETARFYSCPSTPLAIGVLVAEGDRGGIITLVVKSEGEVSSGDDHHNATRASVGCVEAPVLYFLSPQGSNTIEVGLTAPGTDIVAHLMIYSAEDLPTNQSSTENPSMLDRWSGNKKSHLPSVYCVVYVILRDGQQVEIKSEFFLMGIMSFYITNFVSPVCDGLTDNKTSVCEATTCPMWSEDFYLHVSTGISQIASVLIKVKDASQGITH
jgi:hypothetical protein